MAQPLESLTLEVKHNSAGAHTEVTNLANALTELKTALKGNTGSNLARLASNLDKLQSSLKAFNASKLSRIAKSVQGISGISSIANAASNVKPIETPAVENATAGVGVFDTTAQSQSMEEMKESAEQCSGAVRDAAKANEELSKSAKNAGIATKDAGKKLKDAGDKAKHSAGMFGKVAAAFKRILFYRAIRSVIRSITSAFKDGIQNVAQYSAAIGDLDSATANTSMYELATQGLYVKNTLGALAAQILTALLPVIKQLVGWFTSAVNVINQFFAALQGKNTWTRAKEYAGDYADSLGGATKAAKELKDATLGIDELNVISPDNGSSGGGGASAMNYADMFEEVEGIDSTIQHIADTVKPFLSWVKDNFDKIVEAVAIIGAGMLAWKIGKGVVEFVTMLYKLTFGGGMGAGGQYLGAGLLGAVIGGLLGKGLDNLILGPILSSIFGDDNEYAQAYKNFSWFGENGALSVIATAFSEYEWGNFFSDWGRILGKLWDWITTKFLAPLRVAFSTVWNALVWSWNVVTGALSECYNWFHENFIAPVEYAFSVLWDGLVGAWNTTKEALGAVWTWFDTNIIQPVGSAFSVLWDGLVGAWNTTKEALGAVWTWFDENIIQPVGSALSSLWQPVIDVWENTIKPVLDTVSTWFENNVMMPIKKSIVTVLDALKPLLEQLGIKVNYGALLGRVAQDKYTTARSAYSRYVKDVASKGITPISFEEFAYKTGQYATGGYPSTGEMFLAREDGAELVGRIGNKTAVVNNDQIVDAVSAGVYRAVSSAMGSGAGNGGEQHITIELDGNVIYDNQQGVRRARGAQLVTNGVL